jgi:ParB family chromosome partitioning protein
VTQLRDLAESKRDLLMIDPRKIQVEEGYNVRDLTTSAAHASLHQLAQAIADNGFSIEHPITVRLKGEEIFVVAGHRRRAATMMAIEKFGAEIQSIPCIAEAKGTSDADRCADLVVSNSGEPLTALEIAAVVKRLIGFGWEKVQIAKRLGWETKQTVDNHLDLLAAPQDVQQMVRDNEVSPSVAMHVVRKHGDKAGETLANAKRQAASEGKSRVTTAHVKASTGEFQATVPHVKLMLATLQKIAADGDDDAAEMARDTLEKIGVLKKTNGAAAGHRVAAE